MRQVASFALVFAYVMANVFGQAIHVWSGCEYAHLPHVASVASVEGSDEHHHHEHDHHHGHLHSQTKTEAVVQHSHPQVDHGDCALCHHLAQGQVLAQSLNHLEGSLAVVSLVPNVESVPSSTQIRLFAARGPPRV